MKVLVSNVGSTSLKFKLYEMPEELLLCESKVERVGDTENAIFEYTRSAGGKRVRKEHIAIPSYTAGIELFLQHLTEGELAVLASKDEIGRIGFKTVLSKGHYGVHLLDEDTMEGMRESLFVAPVHNAAYLEAIAQFDALFPGTPKIGVFETAFHTTIPLERKLYAIPYAWYEKYGIMRMGYHGASHSYIAKQAALYGKSEKVISCHLGGSCSVCAIENGKSVDTSFGYSLQTGVMHANRCGDTDAYLIPLLEAQGLSREEILEGLSKKGGLLGISGVSNDMRLVEEAAGNGNDRAALAIRCFVNNIVKFIGAFYAELGGLDQLVFTGGIGENDPRIRHAVCEKLRHMGIALDEARNAQSRCGVISTGSSPVTVSVIPANEELGVARETYGYRN